MPSSDFHSFSWEKPPFKGLAVQASAAPEKLIFLLHGYMGDAESNFEFGQKLAARVPQAQVIIPDGLMPIPSLNDSHHRQWWNLDERSHGTALAGFSTDTSEFERVIMEETVPKIHFAAGVLNRFIVNTAAQEGKKLSDCAVAGISQGGMTAFEMSLFRKELTCSDDALGALIIIGAGISKAERLLPALHLPPIPVFLAGGNQDDIFPPKVNDFSEKMLKSQGLDVTRVQTDSIHYGLEHTVDAQIGDFLNKIWKN